MAPAVAEEQRQAEQSEALWHAPQDETRSRGQLSDVIRSVVRSMTTDFNFHDVMEAMKVQHPGIAKDANPDTVRHFLSKRLTKKRMIEKVNGEEGGPRKAATYRLLKRGQAFGGNV